MNRRYLWATLALTLGFGSAAWADKPMFDLGKRFAAQKQDDTNLYLGGEVSGVFFSQARTKNAFGSSILYYGLTVTQNNIGYNWSVKPDFGFFAASKNDNRLFIVPLMAVVSKKFAKPGDEVQPYVKLGAGIAYFDYRIIESTGGGGGGAFPQPLGGTVRTSGHKFGMASTAEFGVVAAQRFRVFASYNLYSKQSGFDFSGFQIGATISFFKL